MTTVITRGAGSAQALGYAARATAANYIEDVFSTYLYTGNGSTQTITNGVDLSTKGGMVWLKGRSGATDHGLFDTARGVGKGLRSNLTSAQFDLPTTTLTSFNSTGFSIGDNTTYNTSSATYASWTFRKQAKFFDVVTYTGDGSTGYRMINHSLGSVPGFIIIKPTSTTGDWVTLARQAAGTYVYGMYLNQTVAGTGGWDPVANGWLTSTQFTTYIGNTTAETNTNGVTYVAYLFAHDAGGFGASGSDNVISCGSFTGTGSDVTVTLGYEPQWLLVKRATGGTDNWALFDNMRGMFVNFDDNILFPNLSNAELVGSGRIAPTATGFIGAGGVYAASSTYIYIAIRRGPMRTPTSGTSVFRPTYLYQYDINGNASSGNGIHGYLGNVSDAYIQLYLSGSASNALARTRLTGANYLVTSSTATEVSGTTNFWDNNVASGFVTANSVNNTISTLNFRRAPGFFDVVCYTGNGTSGATQSHNLAAVPEMWIVKRRSTADYWVVGTSARGSNVVELNTNGAEYDAGTAYFSNGSSYTAPTSTAIRLGSNARVNASGNTYVAYLFATVAGVSKVGSYTGTGTTLQVNCGFTGGARFVLIKRTDSTGDWYVWDSARGIVAGNDPYLLLNSTAAEVTNTDYVDTYSAGFEISSTAPAAINANGGTFIFLAIA